jgi:hypothetical protein
MCLLGMMPIIEWNMYEIIDNLLTSLVITKCVLCCMFSTYGISNCCNPQYIPIYGIVGLHPLLCDGPQLTCAPLI